MREQLQQVIRNRTKGMDLNGTIDELDKLTDEMKTVFAVLGDMRDRIARQCYYVKPEDRISQTIEVHLSYIGALGSKRPRMVIDTNRTTFGDIYTAVCSFDTKRMEKRRELPLTSGARDQLCVMIGDREIRLVNREIRVNSTEPLNSYIRDWSQVSTVGFPTL